MDKKLKRKWVKALRSGKYAQGQSKLRTDDDHFCCLGVLCEVLGRKWYRPNKMWGIKSNNKFDSTGELDDRLISHIGDHKNAVVLTTMNDTGSSFEKIAAYIETNL